MSFEFSVKNCLKIRHYIFDVENQMKVDDNTGHGYHLLSFGLLINLSFVSMKV